MGLRCLLGHDFGDVEVERDREEEGNEMVVTIREVETCDRCGKERVVSENKEVTSIKTPEEAGIDADADEPVEADTPTHPAVEEDAREFEAPEPPEEDDAVILGDEEPKPDRKPGEWPDAEQPQSSTTPMQDEAGGPDADEESEPSAESTAELTEDVAAVEEGSEPAPVEGEEADVEFLEADDEREGADAASSAGEPSAEDSASEWPEHTGEDEGFNAEAGGGEGVSFRGNGLTPEVDAETVDDEDVEFIDAGDAAERASFNGSESSRPDPAGVTDSAEPGAEHTEYSGSAEPGAEHTEYSGSAEPGAEYVESEGNAAVEDVGGSHISGPTTESTGQDTGTGIAREGTASIDLGPTDADTEYYCPNCGMTRNAGGSSMRAGDICPECRKGYITERDI